MKTCYETTAIYVAIEKTIITVAHILRYTKFDLVLICVYLLFLKYQKFSRKITYRCGMFIVFDCY